VNAGLEIQIGEKLAKLRAANAAANAATNKKSPP